MRPKASEGVFPHAPIVRVNVRADGDSAICRRPVCSLIGFGNLSFRAGVRLRCGALGAISRCPH